MTGVATRAPVSAAITKMTEANRRGRVIGEWQVGHAVLEEQADLLVDIIFSLLKFPSA